MTECFTGFSHKDASCFVSIPPFVPFVVRLFTLEALCVDSGSCDQVMWLWADFTQIQGWGKVKSIMKSCDVIGCLFEGARHEIEQVV